MNDLYDIDEGSPPPWLYLLSDRDREWREEQILKGRNPDEHIESQLREGGLWPDSGSRNK